MSETPVCGVFAHRFGVGSEDSGGGDDVAEVGLERIALHGETEDDVDRFGACGPVLGDSLDRPVWCPGERPTGHPRRHLGTPLLLDAIEFRPRVRGRGAEVEHQVHRARRADRR